MLGSQPFDDPAQHQRVVAGEHRVIQMGKVHLELRPAIFRRGRARRHALGDTGRINLGQDPGPFIQFVKGQNPRCLWRAARPGGQGRGDAALVVALWVDEVEFQLIGHHGPQTQFGKARHHRLQDRTRIEPPRRLALGRGRRDLHLRGRHFGPRHRHQGAGQGVAGGVRITIGKADAVHIPAGAQGVQRGDPSAERYT